MLPVHHTLDGRSADRAGLAKATVNGHPVVEGCDLFRKTIARFLLQSFRPFGQDVNGRPVQRPKIGSVQLTCELERRQLRAVENLVRLRVANPTEEVWVGQRALQGVAFALQHLGEGLDVRGENVPAAGIVGSHFCFAQDDE